ncbi:MAG TPA: DUF4386 domain-containing protein [Flavipsychrobacter sp.]
MATMLMQQQYKIHIRLVGLLYLLAMVAGIFSIAPSVDAEDYLTQATANGNEVIIAAVFQFIMSLIYIGVAILLYPVIRQFAYSLALGFLTFRIIAVKLSIIGTVLLLSILVLSHEFVQNSSGDASVIAAIGGVLKTTRDYINHVFMVWTLCAGNILLFVLLFKSQLVPRWLSVWGLVGAVLSVIAAALVLFGVFDIITAEYLALNVPTALQEIVFGLWLLIKGFD